VKTFLSSFCFLIELKKMFKTSSSCLRQFAAALIHSRPHATLHLIPPSLYSIWTVEIWILSTIKSGASCKSKSIQCRNQSIIRKRSQATCVGCVWLWI